MAEAGRSSGQPGARSGAERGLRGASWPSLSDLGFPTGTAEEDDAPISMRGMRLSLQASQANLLDKGKEGKADDDEDWDDD